MESDHLLPFGGVVFGVLALGLAAVVRAGETGGTALGWSFGQTLAASARVRSVRGLCPEITLGDGDSAFYP